MIKLPSLVGVLCAIFESMENHEDDADDSEWFDSVSSMRENTQSIISGGSEDSDEYDGEIVRMTMRC